MAVRTGFFGGSFDPPHLGHLAVAQAALRRFDLDRVLLAPVAVQPLKHRGGYASYADRLQMVELLCGGHAGLTASAADAPRERGAPNYTVDTLRQLQSAQPEAELFSIVGLDSFRTLREWRQPDELLQLAQWIVVSRPGSSFDEVAGLQLSVGQLKKVHRLDSVNVPVSATEIRARLADGDPCTEQLPVGIRAFIQERRLYGT